MVSPTSDRDPQYGRYNIPASHGTFTYASQAAGTSQATRAVGVPAGTRTRPRLVAVGVSARTAAASAGANRRSDLDPGCCCLLPGSDGDAEPRCKESAGRSRGSGTHTVCYRPADGRVASPERPGHDRSRRGLRDTAPARACRSAAAFWNRLACRPAPERGQGPPALLCSAAVRRAVPVLAARPFRVPCTCSRRTCQAFPPGLGVVANNERRRGRARVPPGWRERGA